MNSRSTCAGFAWPAVSARLMVGIPASTNRFTISRTRTSGTAPSKPHPKADCTETCTVAPASRAAFAMAMIRSAASAVLMPVFLRLWVSEADTPMHRNRAPHVKARSIPFSLSTRPESRVRAGVRPGSA